MSAPAQVRASHLLVKHAADRASERVEVRRILDSRRIVGEFAVPFEYPRSPDLRFDPAFAELSGEISHALRGAHA